MQVRELAVLGFVSFTATVILQFIHLPEDKKMIFEFAHVLMFGTAIAYALEIGRISSQVSTRGADLRLELPARPAARRARLTRRSC